MLGEILLTRESQAAEVRVIDSINSTSKREVSVDNAVNRTFFPKEVNITNQSRTLSIPFTDETTFIMIMSLS